MNPRVPEMVVKPELENIAKTYGKFWCTWQTDRGITNFLGLKTVINLDFFFNCVSKNSFDYLVINLPACMHAGDRLPLGPPALMMSPQAVNLGMVKPELLQKRDDKYNISSDALKTSRVEIAEPEWLNPQADYWKQHGKGFKIDVETTEMNRRAPFP